MEIGQLLLHLKEKRKVNEIKQKIVCTHSMKFGIILDCVSHTSRKHHSLMTNENFENPTMDECINKLSTSIVNQNLTNTSINFNEARLRLMHCEVFKASKLTYPASYYNHSL